MTFDKLTSSPKGTKLAGIFINVPGAGDSIRIIRINKWGKTTGQLGDIFPELHYDGLSVTKSALMVYVNTFEDRDMLISHGAAAEYHTSTNKFREAKSLMISTILDPKYTVVFNI